MSDTMLRIGSQRDVSPDRRPQLSTSEVCEMFGVTRTTLTLWIKNGKILEPARNPSNGYQIWGQPAELNAIATAVKSTRKSGARKRMA
jgi:MerR family regulatory protein